MGILKYQPRKKLDPRITCLCGECRKCRHRDHVRRYRAIARAAESDFRLFEFFTSEVAKISKILYKPPFTKRSIPYAD